MAVQPRSIIGSMASTRKRKLDRCAPTTTFAGYPTCTRSRLPSPQEQLGPMLDVHPSHEAAHSWKDFFTHIATIVVGLLIAVGLEQTVEHLHWRHEVEAQRAAMDAELSENAAFAYERLVATPCLDSRLTELRQAVLASGPKWAGDRMRLGGAGLLRNEAYEAPLRPWPD